MAAQSQLQELTLTYRYERIRFANGSEDTGTAILECLKPADDSLTDLLDNTVIVKCECGPNDFCQGLEYRFYGRWVTHHKHGRQFQAKTFVRTQPHSQQGIIRYLQQAPWVGMAVAKKLWEKFGSDAVRIMREQPDVAVAAVGGSFTADRAAEASQYLVHEQAIESTTIDMIDLLAGRGFPKSIGKRAVAEWGNRAAELIRQNPYLLMRFRGCGFMRCDQLFLDLGGQPDRLKRQALCAWYSIARDTEGHTWYQPAVVERGLRERIAGTNVAAVPAVKLAKRGRLLTVRRDDQGELWLADAKKAANEATVAERVRDWLREPSAWPAVGKLDVSDHQRTTLADALAAPISDFHGRSWHREDVQRCQGNPRTTRQTR